MLEEQTQGYAGTLKVQVAGPWTLAATVEKPRGDKVLADFGARRELAQALAEGLRDHLADVRRRVPGAELVLQVDEPALPPCWPGRSRRPPASAGTARSTRPRRRRRSSGCWRGRRGRRRAVGRTCCAAGAPLDLLRGAGAARRLGRPRRARRARDLRRAGDRARAGETGRPRRRPVDRPAAPADRRAGHRVGRAAARHARPRPRRGGRTSWCSPRLRAGRRVAASWAAAGAARC